MKIRSALLVVSGLLLAVAAVAATAPAAPTVPAALAMPSNAACATSMGPGHLASLAASRASTFFCGACSDAPCAGAAYNSLCYRGSGLDGQCVSPLGNSCNGNDATPACQCWYGPLP